MMKWTRLARVVAAVSLVAALPGLAVAQDRAPAPDELSAMRQDMQAVRRSVEDLVTVMKQFLAESGRRERASVLLRRIEVAEQQAANLGAELRAARTELAEHERLVDQSRGRVQSARSMAGFDRGGANAPLLQQEETNALGAQADAENAAALIRQRIADLERDLDAKRVQVRAFEAQLEKELPAPLR
ncbi:MAG: hypothetical protein R2712_27380 [Vicinamibacterales bacterium]